MGGGAYGVFVFLVDLDGLVGLARDESAAGDVERARVDARLAVQRARLDGGAHLLEVVAGLPVPQVHAPVVSCKDVF